MSSDMPDWLRDLSRGVTDGEDDMPVEPEPEPEPEFDPLADLRSQMDEEPESVAPAPAPVKATPHPRRRSSSKRDAMGLLPWQRFILSVLLFFDIAFVGMLFLVMLGRIAFPVS